MGKLSLWGAKCANGNQRLADKLPEPFVVTERGFGLLHRALLGHSVSFRNDLVDW